MLVQDSLNSYNVWLEVVKTTGIVLTGLIALLTLRVSRQTHAVANSRLSETIDKVDILTRALAISETKEKK